jgi:peptidyl-prolyl cis-trans isomerase C
MLAMISKRTNLNVLLSIMIVLSLVYLVGCTPPQVPAAAPVDPTSPDSTAALETETVVVQPPTPTAVELNLPLAALVNGEGILLSEYEAELQRYADAMTELGKPVDPEQQRAAVLTELVDQVLLAQSAYTAGFILDDAALAARITELGDPQALADWQSAHSYDSDSFSTALRRQAAAAWQRDRIAAAVPERVEQVQARQMLVFDRDLANRLHNRLKDGADFATVARQIDPTGGELGWFPRGYLTLPEIETAAFELQAGQYSEVIETAFGYHIVQVIAHETAQPVSADVRRFLQHKALQSWLEEQRTSSQVEILLP